MARKTASRLQKRREAEAASSVDKKASAKKKVAKKRVSKRKVKAPDRKRLLWGVFTGTLKEEARFPYDQRKEAEQKLEQLRAKSKKLYFIQPIKEVISDAPAKSEEAAEDEEIPDREDAAEEAANDEEE